MAILLAAALATAAAAQTHPTTTGAPATQSATSRPATTQSLATVSEEAAPLLAKLSDAYLHAGPLKVSGTIIGRFDVAGRSKTYTLDVFGQTDGDGRFYHYGQTDGRGIGLVISDGKNGYLYDQHRNSFAELDVTRGRCEPGDLNEAISDVLIDENPALLLCLTNDPASLLRMLTSSIKRSDGKDASELVLDLKSRRITLRLDEKTGRITRSTIDYGPIFTTRHAAGVKSVSAVLTYTVQQPGEKISYTWSPPATASQMRLGNELLRGREDPTTRPAAPHQMPH